MRKKIISVLLIALLLLSSMVFAACKKSSDEEATDTVDIDELMEEEAEADDFVPDNPDDPAYQNEEDGAEIVRVSHQQEDFYGTWSARSELAHHLFGNADFTINKDGSWTGNIVDEDFEGKWMYEDGALVIKSSDDLINYRLFYVKDGNMMFEDIDDPDLVPLVLKKQ